MYVVAAGVALAPRPDERVLQMIAMAAFPAVVPLLEAIVMQIITKHSVRISGAVLRSGGSRYPLTDPSPAMGTVATSREGSGARRV